MWLITKENIRQAQKRYKRYYNKKATEPQYRIGDWVLAKFPHEETGRLRKLSQSWHGAYWIVDTCINELDVTKSKVYFPQDNQIQIHMLRVAPCPPEFLAGYY